ncbi:hypothetical protein [Sphingobacterium daejeonense]|uniref:hypothetical protein n=1 Tax=Sphingobacterium daejeonense TaxID=371142 RepID=UPI003D31DC77
MSKEILLIHPHDKTTKFLNRIKNHLINSYRENIHHFNIKPRDDSHDTCLKQIIEMPPKSLIIFMGHSNTKALFGSRSDDYEMFAMASEDALIDNPNVVNFFNNSFITSDNIDVFNGKSVFCLSCNSKFLGKHAIERGANAFIGFGDIPASNGELNDKGYKNVSRYLVSQMKTELNMIIKVSLAKAIKDQYDFQQLYNFIKLLINQRIGYHLIDRKRKKERFAIADYLYFLKKDITLLGDEKAPVFIKEV